MKNPFNLLNSIRRSSEDNPFRPRTLKEKQDAKKQEKEVQNDVLRMARICGDILSDQRYKEFADIFRDIEKRLQTLMVDCDLEDQAKYFLKMRDYQMKLRFFRNILSIPHEFIDRAREIEKVNRTEVK